MVELLWRLRDLFGKPRVGKEDAIRLDGLRRREANGDGDAATADPSALLDQVGATIAASFDRATSDPRPLELVNKTNQFNLNGRRHAEGAWRDRLARPEAFLLRVAYEDKFGPLGTISVVSGEHRGDTLHVDVWVLSCRAFSRRIEHRTLELLFRQFEADAVVFDFAETPRNGPTRDFLRSLPGGESGLGPGFRVSRDAFLAACPPLPHQIKSWDHD